MPYSAKTFDPLCCQLFGLLAPQTILDVGCGAGKYGRLTRSVRPGARVVGYEVEPSYVERFSLGDLYDELRVASASELLNSPSEHFDLCVFGDSLEHFRKSDGLDLVHFLLHRSKAIMIICPIDYLQDDFEGVHSEAHISSWSPAEFAMHADIFYAKEDEAWLGLIRGYEMPQDTFASIGDRLGGMQYGLKYLPRIDF